MSLSGTQIELIKRLADGQEHSGELLGQALGVSRAAVWKALKGLAEFGLTVNSEDRKGYQLDRRLSLLDQAHIEAAISPALSQRLTLDIVMTCDSTNTRLREQPLPPAPGYRVLLAEHQSAGRGRQGRPWRSGFGQGIYLSMGQELSGGLERLAALSLAIGVGVCRSLQSLGIPDVGLKWPNDLWCQGQKLGGILLEADGEVAGGCSWIAGVGLNWRLDESAEIDQPWIDLARLGVADVADRNVLCASLLEHLVAVSDQFTEQGLAPFLTEWEQLDILTGRHLTVSVGGAMVEGVGAGLSQTGALNVQTASELIQVSSGEVSVRPR